MTRSNKKKAPLKPPPKDHTLYPGVPSSSTSQSSVQPCFSPKKESQIVRRAILSARKHGIDLIRGTPNPATGNCAIESAIFNLNDRSCFHDRLRFSIDYYRRIWMTDMKNRTINNETWNIYTNSEWENGWNEMMKSGVYERGIFGDLMIFAIACGMKKILLIFNTSLESPHDPIYVCDPRKFGVDPDTEIPLVLAYNLAHYESMHPNHEIDVQKTAELASDYLRGIYPFGKNDLPSLLDEGQESIQEKEEETESKTLSDFQMKLPEHLRGKRPRDMDRQEKKRVQHFKNETLKS